MKLCICLLLGLSLVLTAAVSATAADYHLVKKIALGGDGGWDCLTFDSSAHRLYVARSNRVMVVDTDKGTLVGEIANTPGVHGVALVPKLKLGFVSVGGENTVLIFDTNTLKEVQRVKVGTKPDVIIFDPATNRVFSFNGGSNDATAIDATTAKVAGTVSLGGKPEFAVTDGRGRMFVNLEDKSEVVEFDPRTLTVKNRWPLSSGEEPSGLAIDAKHHRLFSACSNEKMAVTNYDSGRVVATPTIGKGPDGAGFDPATHLALSPNGADGTLTVIHQDSPDKYSVIGTVPTQVSARTMALDPKTHTVYLAAARFVPPAPGSTETRGRRKIEPNSFVILVIGM